MPCDYFIWPTECVGVSREVMKSKNDCANVYKSIKDTEDTEDEDRKKRKGNVDGKETCNQNQS